MPQSSKYSQIPHWLRQLFVGHEIKLTALLMLAWLLGTIGLRTLALPDEGRYVGVAWEMLRTDQWLTPTLNGLPYFHKPPLFYWLTAVSLQVFGAADWAARFAPLFGACVAAAAIYVLTRRWLCAASARWTLVILATCPIFYGGAQYANHDMLVAGLITATIAFAADAVLAMQNSRQWRVSLLLAWAAAALGLLSKGLIGIVLPGGVIIFWLLIARQWRLIPRLLWWPAPLLFLLIAAPWFGLMQLKYPGFLHYFFIEQQFQRFTASGFNNVQPFWFYPAALFLLTLPWAPLLFTRLARSASSNPVQRNVVLLLWVWLVFIVLFFSIPQSKLIGYALPVLPALAALIADGLVRHRFWGKDSGKPCAVIAVLAAILCLCSVWAISKSDDTSSYAMTQAYRQKAQPGEPLIFVNVYPFDFAFYSQLKSPVPVLGNWDPAIVNLRDSWRKELLDASFFDTSLGQQVLLADAALPGLLCQSSVTWLVTENKAKEKNPLLLSAERVAASETRALLRVSKDAAACAEKK